MVGGRTSPVGGRIFRRLRVTSKATPKHCFVCAGEWALSPSQIYRDITSYTSNNVPTNAMQAPRLQKVQRVDLLLPTHWPWRHVHQHQKNKIVFNTPPNIMHEYSL